MTEYHKEFACIHGDHGESEMEDLVTEVKRRLQEGSSMDITDANLLSAIVYSLEWDYNARITSIDCDQWCAVSAQSYELEETESGLKVKDKPAFQTYIQCDLVEHGMAATWKAFADFEKRKNGNSTPEHKE